MTRCSRLPWDFNSTQNDFKGKWMPFPIAFINASFLVQILKKVFVLSDESIRYFISCAEKFSFAIFSSSSTSRTFSTSIPISLRLQRPTNIKSSEWDILNFNSSNSGLLIKGFLQELYLKIRSPGRQSQYLLRIKRN